MKNCCKNCIWCRCYEEGTSPVIENECKIEDIEATCWRNKEKSRCVEVDEREQKEIAELKDTVEALESELKEVCDVLIRKCPEMKEWVMLNWRRLYDCDKS